MAQSKKDRNVPLGAANLIGITSLMNIQHINPKTNLTKAEESMISTPIKKTIEDPVKIYNNKLSNLAKDLGINLFSETSTLNPTAEGLPSATSTKRKKTANKKDKDISKVLKSFEDSEDSENSEDTENSENSEDTENSNSENSEDTENSNSENLNSENSENSDDSDDSDDTETSETSESSESLNDRYNNFVRDPNYDIMSSKSTRREANKIISGIENRLGIAAPVPIPHNTRSQNITNEQEQRRHINDVLNNIRKERRTTFGVERERVQDAKASKLEQISQLRLALEEEGVDCSSVSNPILDSSMEEIDSVLNILRLKNDRNRYSSLAEEVMLGLAEAVETVFDGTRPIPLLGWKPDYTGYHNTVNVKLHRMRFETSQIVSNIIEKYNIGPTARIVMELLPSFFLYPRQMKKQKGSPGLFSDPRIVDARQAYETIRDSDEHKTIDDLRRI